MSTTKQQADATENGLPNRVAQWLAGSRAYPERTRAVECLETHISRVYLTDRHAYKLKKPVRFDFLDFSTPELRRKACEQELKLNRRLAPGVYLDVLPITLSGRGALSLAGHGEAVDWVVKMRRLPADAALDVMIQQQRVLPGAVDQLADRLAEFYDQLPPVTITVDDYRQRVERHVMGNYQQEQAHHLDPLQVRRVHAAQLRLLKLAPGVLDDRVVNGRIVEGHGDLRPEHVYFNPGVVIIDCIEFSAEFRTLDVVDELAFFAMECDHLGAESLGRQVLERYLQSSGDRPPPALVDFYRAYRASVRAKVCALRSQQAEQPERSRQRDAATRYLELADRYRRGLGPPLLVLVHGLPGTGKSTIAELLRDELALEPLQTDAVRQLLFPDAGDGQPEGYQQGRYQPQNRAAVYDHIAEQAERLLQQEVSVVADGTYLSAQRRSQMAALARRHGAGFLSVRCRCPQEVALERIQARVQQSGSLSETRPEFFQRQQAAYEPDPPEAPSLTVETSRGIVVPRQAVYTALRRICFARERVRG